MYEALETPHGKNFFNPYVTVVPMASLPVSAPFKDRRQVICSWSSSVHVNCKVTLNSSLQPLVAEMVSQYL